MRVRVVVEVEMLAECTLSDAAEIAEQCAALLLLHRDKRIEAAEAAGAERLPSK